MKRKSQLTESSESAKVATQVEAEPSVEQIPEASEAPAEHAPKGVGGAYVSVGGGKRVKA